MSVEEQAHDHIHTAFRTNIYKRVETMEHYVLLGVLLIKLERDITYITWIVTYIGRDLHILKNDTHGGVTHGLMFYPEDTARVLPKNTHDA